MNYNNINIANVLSDAHKLADEARAILSDITSKGISQEAKPDKTIVTLADIQIEKQLRNRIAELYPDVGVIGEEFPESNPQAASKWILDPIDGTEEFVNRIPNFGSIIGFQSDEEMLAGVIDHPHMDFRVSGAKGLGVRCNKLDLERLDAGEVKDDSEIRIGISKKKNFLRFNDNHGDVFNALIEAFPNPRIFDTCYAYTCAITGSIDVMVDWNIRIWDHSAAMALIPENGGIYHLVNKKVRDSDATGKVIASYSAVFGKPWAVDKVVKLLETIL